MRVTDLLGAIWKELTEQEEVEAKQWMTDQLSSDKFIFDDIKDVREWALKNTDLQEPEEEK